MVLAYLDAGEAVRAAEVRERGGLLCSPAVASQGTAGSTTRPPTAPSWAPKSTVGWRKITNLIAINTNGIQIINSVNKRS